jgi:4-amino-4-deoxy-L-arabinose transferase-like glycosyltransferase
MITFLKKYHLTILIALTVIFGAYVITYSTKNNPWGFTDSIAYLVSARNLANGTGLGYHHPDGAFRFLTHYPPFYPLVLGVMDFLGMQVIDAARLLDILLFPATLSLVALTFYRFSHMPHLGLAAAILLFSFEPMLLMAASAMSEPLFVFLSVASGLCLLLHLERGGNRWLAASALCASASALTRYIGAAWIVTGVLSLFLFSHEDWKTRFRRAVRFLLISALPVLLWFLWVYAFADKSVGGRTINFDPADLFDQLEPFRGLVVTTIWRWLPFQSALDGVRYIWRVVALLALVVISIIASLTASRRANGMETLISDFHVFSIFGIFSAAYLVLLMLIYSFSSPNPGY